MLRTLLRGAVLLGAGAALLAPRPAAARIDLVTLPSRDKTQVTIYKSEDLTLVRETRRLTFNEGDNQIQFTWAGTLIDPTSLRIRFLRDSPDFEILDASYPSGTRNTIIWNIEARESGEADVEMSYFASGLTWSAQYAAFADRDEATLRLEPRFTIVNNSGEDFVNAQTRLVVGEINLVELIRDLATRGLIDAEAPGMRQRVGRMAVQEAEMMMDGAVASFAPAAAPMRAEAAEIIKAAVSEYYLYTIQGEEDLRTGWSKQLPNPAIEGIPIDVSYEWNPRRFGNQVVKFYKFKNDEDHELGETPLPAGSYYAYSDDGRGALRFQGRFDHDYVPIGDDVEIRLGSDGLVSLEARTMAHRRLNIDFGRNGDVTGHESETAFEVEIRNSTARTAPFKMTLPVEGGDWTITESSHDFRRVDQNTIELELDAPAESSTVVTYTIRARHGSRAGRS